MMWRLVAGKLLRVVAVVWSVGLLAWLLAEAAGSAPERAARAAGALPADDSQISAELRSEILAQIGRRHGLDRSLPTRLISYSGDLLRFEFGRSWRHDQPIAPHLARATLVTSLMLMAVLVLAIALGGLAAIVSARTPGGAADVGLSVAAAVAIASPPVWLGILALRTFAAGEPFQWLPVSAGGSLASWVLPILLAALVPAFVIARYGRAALVEASRTPWAIAVRARGVSTRRLIAVHALRASLPQLLPLATVLAAYLLGAFVVLEELFGIFGLGHMLIEGSRTGDTPVIVAASTACAFIVAVVSAVVDLARRFVAPVEAA